MNDLITVTRIATLLGVSRQRVFTLIAEHPEFPRPVIDAPRRRLWERQDVDRWVEQWPRSQGRPPAPYTQAVRQKAARIVANRHRDEWDTVTAELMVGAPDQGEVASM